MFAYFNTLLCFAGLLMAVFVADGEEVASVNMVRPQLHSIVKFFAPYFDRILVFSYHSVLLK